MKRLLAVVCLILMALVAGCGESEAGKQARAEQAEQARLQREYEELKQRQQQAMLAAVAYDKALGEQVAGSRSLGEVVFGASDETIASYVRNLKRVPLDDCPTDFRRAYETHIQAWESRNQGQIRSTWMDVVAIARLHGVTVPE